MVIFGVVMSGAVVLEALLWSRTEMKRAVITAAACAAAPMVSPLGWSYWPQVLATVSVSRELQIQEYQMPEGSEGLVFWAAAGALVLAAVVQRHRLREHSRTDRILLIASSVLAVAAAMAARNVAFFAVLAAPALSRFWPMREAVSRRPARPAGVPARAMVLVALLVGAAVVALKWRDAGAQLGWQPMSAATIEAVRECPDPIFNQMEDGGFLMWALPDRRVFVDSRMEAYPLELLRRSREVDLGGDHTDLFRDYRIACAITPTDSPLRERLARDRSMTIIHSDAQRTVFARSPARAASSHDPQS